MQLMSRSARRLAAGLSAGALVLVAGCGGRSADPAPSGSGSGQAVADLLKLGSNTPNANGETGTVTWALYRNISTLDPASAFDYPENTVISSLCDAVLRQQPDGSITPGLASYTFQTPTSLVLTVSSSARFWDGKPVTADDVAFSLQRHREAQVASFYSANFNRVKSIVTSGNTVTITLSAPDYWLPGELSAMGGIVLERSYVESKGLKYGTPQGGVMCSGPFELKKWTSGQEVQVIRNPNYWDSSLQAKATEIDFVGVSDAAALTSGLSTGQIDGTWITDTSNIAQLQRISGVKVYLGPSLETEFLIPSNLRGVLGSQKVRQALSLAFNRTSYINAVYDGDAAVPRLPSNPGTWGFAKNTFSAAWGQTPAMTQNLAKAKQLIQEAGATGKKFVIGTSTDLATVATEANAWQQAAISIGLNATLYNVSAENYINFFTDASARQHVDAFSTTTYGDYADPSALDSTYVLPGGSQNYSNYNNPTIAALLDKARSEVDPTQRAKDDIAAEQAMLIDLPWIPVAHPASFLVLNKKLTGAPTSFAYMQAPWLARVGSAS
ncbi:MAG: ABC transporter substrate-binding protein [Actinomycetota bacterium]|nr:ABC transporter substrate-binding protein [Actinomycetota bacterium]